MSELHSASVDLAGLLTVLGENLYSTPDVALRELVQNAHDSCNRRRIEQGPFEPRIDLATNNRKLTVSDNGSGLTHQEIIDYLATVGAGYTRLLKNAGKSEDLIGQFGLGFLSAYVVADKVEVITTSYQTPDETWRFISRDGQRYSLERTRETGPVGTKVILSVTSESQNLADADEVGSLARRFCCLLPIPVYAPEQVNTEPPPWRQSGLSDVRLRKRRLEFASLFDPVFDPLCAFPIESAADLSMAGVIWLQDGSSYASSDMRQVSLFVHGMLISDDARELLPRWAGFAGAIIECEGLVPTASRETIKENEAFIQVKSQVCEALIDGLENIARSEPETWRSVRRRHNESLLGACLADDRLFEAMHDRLLVPTSEGDLSIAEITRRTDSRIIMSTGDESGYEQVIHRALQIPVVNGSRFGAAPFVRRCADHLGLQLVIIGTREGDSSLFERVESEEYETLRALFGDDETTIVAARYKPASLPVVVVPNREVLLKRALENDDADRRIAGGILGLARQHTKKIDGSSNATMYINVSSPLITRLLEAEPKVQQDSADILRSIAELTSRSNSSEIERNLGSALERFGSALERLMQRASA
jgi:molecular chaperone HtpG